MYKSIQYLRGIAAIAVVIKHAAHPGGRIEGVLDGGVDLFFIISGFVMVVSTQGRDMGAPEFLTKRAARIFPIWWLALAAAILLRLGDGRTLSDWMLSAALIPTSVAYGLGHVSWGVGWTLVFEMLFYLIFAAGLALRSKWFSIAVIMALAAYGHMFGHHGIPIAHDLTSALLLEFVVGMLIAKYAPPLSVVPAAIAGALGIALLVLPLWPLEPRAICLGGPIGLVVFSIVGLERKYGMLKIDLLQFFGDASYSIYLFHYMAIGLLWHIVKPDSHWPITAMVGIALGAAVYVLAEAPLQSLIKTFRRVRAA